MAVLHARIEMDALAAQPVLKIADKDVCLFRGDVSRGMVLQQVTLDAYQIATHGHVAGL